MEEIGKFSNPIYESSRDSRKSLAKSLADLIMSNRNRFEPVDERVLFSYPFVGINCITIIVDDMNRLDEGQFLNDSIIDFYLRYILIEDRSLKAIEKTFVYSSFFYRKLTTTLTSQPVPFDRVKGWTSKIDVFALDFLIIPINEHAHWFMAIILFPGRLLNSADNMSTVDASALDSMTYLVICDSLGQSRPGAIEHLKDYLVASVKDRKPDIDVQMLKQSIIGVHANLPQQPNSVDCGVYVLQYVELFLKDPYIIAPKLLESAKALEDWFKPVDITNKRKALRSLCKKIQTDWNASKTEQMPQEKPAFSVDVSEHGMEDGNLTGRNGHSGLVIAPSDKTMGCST